MADSFLLGYYIVYSYSWCPLDKQHSNSSPPTPTPTHPHTRTLSVLRVECTRLHVRRFPISGQIIAADSADGHGERSGGL